MQRLKVRNLKAPAGTVLSIGTSGNVTSNTNNTLFGVTSASFSSGIFNITCFGFTSNSNVYLGRTQLINNGLRGNTITATANTEITNGIYNVNLYDQATGGSAVLPNGITYADYNAWISGRDTLLLRMSMVNLTAGVSTRTTNAINARENAGAVATADNGWVAAGGSYPTYYSSVNRLTFSSDTSGYSTRSNLPYSIVNPFSVTDQTTYGWFGGGYTSSFAELSNICRLIYSNDTTNLTQRSTMAQGLDEGAGTFNTNYGWFFAGHTDLGDISTIQRMDFSQDTTTPSTRGAVNSVLVNFAAVGTNDYGWTLGGAVQFLSPATSTVSRLTYSNDTTTTSIRGPLVSNSISASLGMNTNTDGFVAGGPSLPSAIHRIQFANDTATGTVLSSNLGGNRLYDAAFDNFIH